MMPPPRNFPLPQAGGVSGGPVLLALILAAGCTAQAPREQQQPEPTVNAAAPTLPPALPPAQAPTTPAQTGLAPLTAEGWRPLRIGMTRAQITAALGPDANPDAVGPDPDPEQCDQYRPARAPEGVLLMVEGGRLTRISLIRNARVKTDRGLGLGASPAAVRAAYGDRLQAQPHEYEAAPAQYLIAWEKGGGPAGATVPPASRGIVYEVNASGKVAMIHAGGPSILYVEGCS